MDFNLLPQGLGLLGIALQLAVLAVLIRKYRRTGDTGLLWLAAAVVVWPVLSGFLHVGERALIDRAFHRQFVFFPFDLVERGSMTIGSLTASLAMLHNLVSAGLLLLAALQLEKGERRGSPISA